MISAYSLHMPSPIPPVASSPPGIKAIGAFLMFGATMACVAGTTLLRPGAALGRVWALNPRAYNELAPYGKSVGFGFLLLAVLLALAGVGWFKRRRWGWQLAAAIIATQVLGDLVNMLQGRVVQGGTGVVIAGALLLYILRPNMRAAFAPGRKNTSIQEGLLR